MDLNPVDLVAIGLVILAALLGFRSGALPQIGGLLGAIAGGVLAILVAALVRAILRDVDPTLRPLLVLGGLLLAVGARRDPRLGRRPPRWREPWGRAS